LDFVDAVKIQEDVDADVEEHHLAGHRMDEEGPLPDVLQPKVG
jgi:hypothetical protein